MTARLSPREAARLRRWTVADLARVLEAVDPEAVPADVAAELAPTWRAVEARTRALVEAGN
jgi:hypothetical protein